VLEAPHGEASGDALLVAARVVLLHLVAQPELNHVRANPSALWLTWCSHLGLRACLRRVDTSVCLFLCVCFRGVDTSKPSHQSTQLNHTHN
jgi:hypothetical protein